MPWRLETLQHVFAFERAVVTPYSFATTLVPTFLIHYAMAVLVQLPHTNVYRVALLPVVFWLTLRTIFSLDLSWNYPGYAYHNKILTLGTSGIAMRSATWAFAERTYSKLQPCKSVDGQNGNILVERDVRVSSAFWNAWDLLLDVRGIRWSGPPKIPIPTPYFRVESRSLFALLSFCHLIIRTLAFGTLASYLRSLGPDTFGSPEGGTIFDSSLPSPQRYLKSSIITLIVGTAAYLVIDGVYHLAAVLFTILFQHHPSHWPPLFDSPWLSTSLASFWGRRWHQLLRECFVVVGGEWAQQYLGRTGSVMVAFTISGALHDIGVRGMGRGTDTLPVVGFFLMQGIGVMIEGAWKKATGRRVGGFIGWLWVASWLLLWGNGLVDAWAKTGLFGSECGPNSYMPSMLFPNWISPK